MNRYNAVRHDYSIAEKTKKYVKNFLKETIPCIFYKFVLSSELTEIPFFAYLNRKLILLNH